MIIECHHHLNKSTYERVCIQEAARQMSLLIDQQKKAAAAAMAASPPSPSPQLLLQQQHQRSMQSQPPYPLQQWSQPTPPQLLQPIIPHYYSPSDLGRIGSTYPAEGERAPQGGSGWDSAYQQVRPNLTSYVYMLPMLIIKYPLPIITQQRFLCVKLPSSHELNTNLN